MKKGEFLSFIEARLFTRNLGLKNQKEWRKWRTSGLRPNNIPSNPYEYYLNKGWDGWGDWLNTNNAGYNCRKYNVNDNYFKKWSHDMAYILGFWFSDGNTDGITTFSISQHKNEKYLLENILVLLKSNYPLRKNRNNYSFLISSSIIIKDILRLGGKANKSLDIKFPKIPKKYLPDFIRGLWDGDGCIYYNTSLNSYHSEFTSGSKLFVINMQSILRDSIPNLIGNFRCDFRKKGRILSNGNAMKKDSRTYSLRFGNNDTRRLRNFMYSSSPELRMKRKYDKFMLAGPLNERFIPLSFCRAKKYINGLKLKSLIDWEKYHRKHKKTLRIPINLYQAYSKNKKWKGIPDFLGYKIN